jgi:class 3 adenylate cyclase/tetratricopeptide (TPR) repeat protein
MNLCAACGADNRAGRKFCGRCGAPLAIGCPTCGTTNEPDELFCGECGTALAFPAPSSPSPEAVSVSGEKKQITVLFADVAGSMDLQEQLDAEVWANIMGRFVGILAEGVRKFGGTVDKFTGDGIMALFGAPVAQEDHARRACHAAWHLTKAIGDYSEELRREQGVELHARLGLNSGEVVVGRVGDDLTLDPTALGHTVGLAQRMETMAEPGRAYLTEHTARLVEGSFHLTDLGPTPIKGSREPVGVFALEGPAPSPPILRSDQALGAAPLVGRERELAVLEEALAAATEGQAQVVGVVGEAGVGKSRLCKEFARSGVARGITVRHTTGLSHGRDVPLLPILALLRDYFSITETDNLVRAGEKVAARILDLDPGLGQDLPLLLDFLEVPDPHQPVLTLAPEVRMRRIFETLRRLAARRSERETLVLIFQDLQWFDPQSEAFLGRLIESFPGSRTLVVTNFRPEFSASWMRHSYYRQLPLGPLRDEAVGEFLSRLLGVDASLAPLVSCVVERTGGNPFFVEELVRAFVEDGTLTGRPGSYRLARPVHEVKVPPTVQAVLAARIDRLPSTQKSVLETAAVIGRTFSAAVLANITGLPEEALDDEVAALCSAELIQQAGADSHPEYSFWHPLTQEVAYSTLLAERRSGLHAAAARAIADIGPARADERAALVASHFERAGDALETARWNARAAAWALRTDLTEAVRRWRATVALLDKVADTEDALRLGVGARGRLLQLGARTGLGAEEATRLYAEGKALAERLGDPALAAAITRFSASVLLVAGRFGAARGRYLEAARLGDETGDRELRASVWLAPAFACIHSGAIPLGISAAERARDLCQGDPECGIVHLGYSPLLRSRAYRAELLAVGGRLEEAEAEAGDTLAWARDRSDVEGVAWLLTTLVRLNDRRGTADEDGVVWAMEAIRITEETGNLLFQMIARTALATAHLAVGRFNGAIRITDETLKEIRGPRNPRYEEANALTLLARAHLGDGHVDVARRLTDDAVQVAHRQEAKVLECLALLTRAQVIRAAGRTAADPSSDLDAALGLVHETGALTYEPFIHEELGRLHGDEDEVREALRLFSAIGATGHARRLEVELAASSPRGGRGS